MSDEASAQIRTRGFVTLRNNLSDTPGIACPKGPYCPYRNGSPYTDHCGGRNGHPTPQGYGLRMTRYARLDPGMGAARNARTARTGTVPERFRTWAPSSTFGTGFRLVLGFCKNPGTIGTVPKDGVKPSTAGRGIAYPPAQKPLSRGVGAPGRGCTRAERGRAMEGTGRGGSQGPLHGPAGSKPVRVRQGQRYQRMAREVVESNPVCAVCGERISLEITRLARHRFMADGVTPNPWYMHRDGGTAGHIVSVHTLRLLGELHRANERSNLRPEHRRCNSSAGGRIGAQLTNGRRAGRRDVGIREPSQEW